MKMTDKELIAKFADKLISKLPSSCEGDHPQDVSINYLFERANEEFTELLVLLRSDGDKEGIVDACVSLSLFSMLIERRVTEEYDD